MAEDYTAKVPPKVRTVAYFTAAITGVLGTALTSAAAILDYHPMTVAALVGVVATAVASVAGFLGAAYRPTAVKPEPEPDDVAEPWRQL